MFVCLSVCPSDILNISHNISWMNQLAKKICTIYHVNMIFLAHLPLLLLCRTKCVSEEGTQRLWCSTEHCLCPKMLCVLWGFTHIMTLFVCCVFLCLLPCPGSIFISIFLFYKTAAGLSMKSGRTLHMIWYFCVKCTEWMMSDSVKSSFCSKNSCFFYGVNVNNKLWSAETYFWVTFMN